MKTLANLFWLFCVFCAMLIFVSSNDDTSQSSKPSIQTAKPIEASQATSEPVVLPTAFKQIYNNIFNTSDDSLKLTLIDKALQVAAQEATVPTEILQQLNIIAADIHQKRWHVVYAIDALKQAQMQIYSERVEQRIDKLRQYLSKVEAERSLNDDYVATRNTGPAKKFTGKVLVAYVYVDDGVSTHWSKRSRKRTESVLAQVQKWQKQKASDYQVDHIEFINRTYMARKNPGLKGRPKLSFKSSASDVDFFIKAVAQSLGANSVGEFIVREAKKQGADQGVLVIHSNYDARSFARRCAYTHQRKYWLNGRYETELISKCNQEFVMLLEQVKRNRWDKLHYAQAHEMMHVFGAADLYNVKNASRFAVTDVMNFQSKYLEFATVDPITAYAIGWQQQKPQAPFNIIDK